MNHRTVRVATLLVAAVCAVWIVQAREKGRQLRNVRLLDPAKVQPTKAQQTEIDAGGPVRFTLRVPLNPSDPSPSPDVSATVDLPALRGLVGDTTGVLNVCTEGRWSGRNVPVGDSSHQQYQFYSFDVGRSTNAQLRVELQIPARVVFSTISTTTFDCAVKQPFPVIPQQWFSGGIEIPVTRTPTAALTPTPVAGSGVDFSIFQNGQVVLPTSRYGSLPQSLATIYDYLDGTSAFSAPHDHGSGQLSTAIADALGQTDGSWIRLAGLVDGNRDYLNGNGAEGQVAWRWTGDTNQRFLMHNVSTIDEVEDRHPGLGDLLSCIGDGGGLLGIFGWDGGGDTATILGLSRTAGVAGIVLGGDQGQGIAGLTDPHHYYTLGDTDGNGVLNLGGTNRELHAIGCARYQGDPAMNDLEQHLLGTDDPAGHGCCVQPPGALAQWIQTGRDVTLISTGDAFPLTGQIHDNGTFQLTSRSTVAGFPDVDAQIIGLFRDGKYRGVLEIGIEGELFGQTIAYDLLGSPAEVFQSGDESVPTGDVQRPAGPYHIVNGDTLTNAGLTELLHGGQIEAGATVSTSGSLVSGGTLKVDGDLIIHSGGDVQCEQLAVGPTGSVQLDDEADLNCSAIRNNGACSVDASSSLSCQALDGTGGTFDNAGALRLGGCSETGTLTNTASGTVFNTGDCTAGTPVQNDGDWFNDCRGSVTGTIAGSGRTIISPCKFVIDFDRQYYPAIDVTLMDDDDNGGVTGTLEYYDVYEPSVRVTVSGYTYPDMDGLVQYNDDDDDAVALDAGRGTSLEVGTFVAEIWPDPGIGWTTTTVIADKKYQHYSLWTGPSLADAADDLHANSLYLNFRTTGQPEGALRGQVYRQPFRCSGDRNWYVDIDRDGAGDNLTVPTAACVQPIGLVDNARDCNDGDSSVFGGAVEINDGQDNNCAGDPGFGKVDELTRNFLVSSNGFVQPPQAGATEYELIRDGSPQFDSAECTGFFFPDEQVDDPAVPAARSTFYYLLRATLPNAGSFGMASDGTIRPGCSPPITDPVASEDTFTVPPNIGSLLDVAENDLVPAGSTFELVTPPTLHADIFDWVGDGTFSINPLTFGGAVSFTYKIVAPGGESQIVSVTIFTEGSRLYQLDEGKEMVSAPVLRLGSELYPLYQFILANSPGDACQEPHWHAFTSVFSMENPLLPVPDPDGPGCGFDKLIDNIPFYADFTAAAWADFLNTHPPFIGKAAAIEQYHKKHLEVHRQAGHSHAPGEEH